MRTNKNYSAIVVFGERAVNCYMNDNIQSIEDSINGLDGSIIKRSFSTQEELNAYIKGLDDADGWLDSAVLDDQFIKKHPRKIKKLLEIS